MRAAAHNPEFAKKVGIPQHVARDFEAADYRGRNYVQPDGSVPKKGPTPPFKKKRVKARRVK
jgi:hypothetical protein